MTDALDELAAKLMDDAANTVDKFYAIVVTADMDTATAFHRLAQMFRDIAKSRREERK